MASVKQAWIKKYGEEEGIRLFKELSKTYGKTNKEREKLHGKEYVENLMKTRSTFNEQFYIEKYGEDVGKLKWQETLNKKLKKQRDNGNFDNGNYQNLEDYQRKYGIKDGYNRWDAKRKKQIYRFSRQYYIDTYGEIDGEVEWKKYCESMNKTSLSSFIKRYGEKEGVIKFNEYSDKISSLMTLESYIERYGEIDGALKWKARIEACNTTSLSSFIKRYGEKEGVIKFNEYSDKISYSHSLEYNIEKYGDEIGPIKYKKNINKRYSSSSHSKISQELFWKIFDNLEYDDRCNVFFGELNKEYIFYITEPTNLLKAKHYIKVDFLFNNKIIEFDGTYWHRNSLNEDINRDTWLANLGYDVLRIGEAEYKHNKHDIIKKCMEFLYDN